MERLTRRLRAASVLASIIVAAVLLPATTALGQGERPREERFSFVLNPIPHDPAADGGSNASGRVSIAVRGDQVTVAVRATGLSPKLVHAQHIHGVGQNRCPKAGARDDRVDDGLIDTVEGLPAYGPIAVSLTTKGDTSADSGLAVNRFPVANAAGILVYVRTFTVGVDFPEEVADNLAAHHIVMHGIDVNNNGAYDFGAGPSSLTSDLPLEATVPANCGVISHRH